MAAKKGVRLVVLKVVRLAVSKAVSKAVSWVDQKESTSEPKSELQRVGMKAGLLADNSAVEKVAVLAVKMVDLKVGYSVDVKADLMAV